ncbi:MAG: aldehyde dehydrogenase (NADP(+)) [Cohaesibacteraceae bacterium]
MLHGKHLIAGAWVDSTDHFENEPVEGSADEFAVGSSGLVDQAVRAAEEAFWSYSELPRSQRAAFLRTIASEIDARGDAITVMGTKETGLPGARLVGERGRTVGQLRLFADHIEKGAYLHVCHDDALPDRKPLPRPDLRVMQVPTGPVGVFGASNFPLAFSVAGGDTASALAAGCPVVVKGHGAHPGTGEIVAQAIDAAIAAHGLQPGVFSLVQGGSRDVGEALVKHPMIRAVGFTGSLAGGRALFDLCTARPDPIPFFGELGSVNPMFVLPGALANRSADIDKGWAASLTLGAGQFCTNPGIAVVPDGQDADDLVASTRAALAETGPQTMLTDSISQAYVDGRNRIAQSVGVSEVLSRNCPGRRAIADLYQVSAADWLANPTLAHEVFGPMGLIVRAESTDQMIDIARSLEGQLTCTLQVDDADAALARALLPVLTRKAGRLLANGFPTGVEVADAMVHGGPYPASTNFGATSVGTLSIRRWLRPVCYQDVPPSLLPDDVR